MLNKKDTLKEVLAFLKITINTLFVAILAIAAYSYSLTVEKSLEERLSNAIYILGSVAIFIFILYLIFLRQFDKLPETLNVRLDANLNNGIILKNDEIFKITLEKDNQGNITIRKG